MQQWNGEYFAEGHLHELGLVIHLGHGGDECPWTMEILWDKDIAEDEDEDDADGSDDIPVQEDPNHLLGKAAPTPGYKDEKGNRYLLVVDRSGVHHLAFRWCICSNAESEDIQLLDMGFYPASFQWPKTVFTCQVLDDFLIDNLECKTSAMSYWNKICRVTSKVFPHNVPVSFV